MAFPSVLNTFNRPATTDRLNSPSHSALHNTVSSALGQVEAVIGVDGASSVVGTMMYDLRSPASGGGGHVQVVNKGGTGQTSYTKGDILVAQSSSVLSKLAVGGAGQVLISDSGVATGVSWGSVAGVPSSIITIIPKNALNLVLSGNILSSPSIAVVWQVPIPVPVRASVITVMSSDTVDASATLDITLYKENGSASVLTVTTPTIDTVYKTYRAYVSPPVNLDAGNYYAMANTNGVTAAQFSMTCWDAGTGAYSVLAALGNVTGSPILNGAYKIAAGAPPTSIVTTALTTRPNAQTDNLYFRIDG